MSSSVNVSGSSGTPFDNISRAEMWLRSVVGYAGVSSSLTYGYPLQYQISGTLAGAVQVSFYLDYGVDDTNFTARISTISAELIAQNGIPQAATLYLFTNSGQALSTSTKNWSFTVTPTTSTKCIVTNLSNYCGYLNLRITSFTLKDGTVITENNRWEGL